jgi:hypothetical protein
MALTTARIASVRGRPELTASNAGGAFNSSHSAPLKSLEYSRFLTQNCPHPVIPSSRRAKLVDWVTPILADRTFKIRSNRVSITEGDIPVFNEGIGVNGKR